MFKHLGYIVLFALFLSCNSSEKTEKTEKTITIIDGSKRYDVYEGSEMANLMKGMFAYNMQLKQEVLDGKITSQFPEEFLKIHTAKFSDTKSRNQTFDYYSGKFIETQKLVFEQDSSTTLTQRYNNAINLCITCHQTECTGPIPKIKKLLIK